MQQGQADELARLQVGLEDGKTKMSILQKRVDEREQRLRKLEGENVCIAIIFYYYSSII